MHNLGILFWQLLSSLRFANIVYVVFMGSHVNNFASTYFAIEVRNTRSRLC